LAAELVVANPLQSRDLTDAVTAPFFVLGKVARVWKND
jgi:hypothetical protein